MIQVYSVLRFGSEMSVWFQKIIQYVLMEMQERFLLLMSCFGLRIQNPNVLNCDLDQTLIFTE